MITDMPRIAIAINNFEKAISRFEDRDRGVLSSVCQAPSSGDIELISANNDKNGFADQVASHIRNSALVRASG